METEPNKTMLFAFPHTKFTWGYFVACAVVSPLIAAFTGSPLGTYAGSTFLICLFGTVHGHLFEQALQDYLQPNYPEVFKKIKRYGVYDLKNAVVFSRWAPKWEETEPVLEPVRHSFIQYGRAVRVQLFLLVAIPWILSKVQQ